jgi:hypothetical protein
MSERFFKVAVLALIVGVGLGLFMGISHQHGYIDTHSHVALMGWVSMAIFGFAYRFWPQLEKGWLRQGHFWLYTVGFVVTVLGLMLLESGKAAAGDPLADRLHAQRPRGLVLRCPGAALGPAPDSNVALLRAKVRIRRSARKRTEYGGSCTVTCEVTAAK